MDIRYCYHGKQVCVPGFAWGPGVKGQYKIMFIHSGQGVYQLDGHTFHLQKGQGFIVYDDILCYMEADRTDPWVYSWVAFTGSGIPSLFEHVQISLRSPIFQFAPLFWSDPYLDKLSDEHIDLMMAELLRQSTLNRFLADWIAMLVTTKQYRLETRPQDGYIRKAIEFIRTNYNQKITIAEIANMIGIDRVYLSVLFKESLQVSPQQYLLNLRMEKAGELLSNSQITVGEVANSVGYSDPLLFSKMFKRVKGLSPSHFRSK